jgi:hypothetical protein
VPLQAPTPNCVGSIDEFASSFNVADRQHLDSLLQLVEASGDLGVFWTLKHVLRVRIPARDTTIDVLGIEQDATVQVPWSIGPYKRSFRPFAETLAAALPGGTAYETNKMWRVRCFDRPPRISDLMQDPEGLSAAFKALHSALSTDSDLRA